MLFQSTFYIYYASDLGKNLKITTAFLICTYLQAYKSTFKYFIKEYNIFNEIFLFHKYSFLMKY